MVNSPPIVCSSPPRLLLPHASAKGGACWGRRARLNGEDNRTALAVGTLMNARGFDGIDHHQHRLAKKAVIEPALFSIMVLMAIVTTPDGFARI